ncbi:hypothetical protein [Epilithonimonas sp. UC225_85]|uniref:hypothetical protein n=1 Tax=Epilithonimonas sp. UC225_85 TaxID=3350167 RepID=UPI0036D42B2A
MENFNEFESKGNVPNRDSGSIISHAFGIYKDIFIYPLVAGLIFFIVISILLSLTGVWAIFMDASQNSGGGYNPDIYRELYHGTPFLTFAGSASLFNILLFSPLVVGTIYIAHKKNIKQDIQFSDLFIGYKQNFLNIVLFGLIFAIVSGICSWLFYIPAVFVMPFLFFGYPFLLFQNISAIEALKRSIDIVKNNYVDILVINLLAYLCSLLGFFACCIGIIITYMFYYSTMYSAYCAYVALPRQLEQN